MHLKCICFILLCTVYIPGIKCIAENNTETALFDNSQNKNPQNFTEITEISTNAPRKHGDVSTVENVKNHSNNTTVKKKKKKKKRKLKKSDLVTLDSANSTFVNNTSKIAKRKKRKRKKKKQNNNNILEITTAKTLLNTTSVISNNANIETLIEQLNKNPNDSVKLKELEEAIKLTENNTLIVKFDQNEITFRNTTKKKNRCKKNNGGCSQICKPKGRVKCSCLEGYTLAKNRKKCVDINECKLNNGGCQHFCKNTLGGYYCDCPEGFRISDDLKSCQDINECHLRNGHGPCQDTCTNTYGAYICDCSHLNGTRLADNKHSCEDIDECEEGTSGCTHDCINTIGTVFCSCPEGMELMSDYKTCQDIDECETASVKNSCQEGCVNTIGSYYCESDFQSDQFYKQAKMPICPPLDPPEYGFITCLRNSSVLYNKGRKILKNIPGTKCHLVCPVGFKLVGNKRLVCGMSGKWLIEKKGFCTKAPHPKLHCPPDQILFLEDGQVKVPVSFPVPQTNVRWQIVTSYPKWAKNLRGELEEGHHNIQFSVTDPATKLSSTCSFFITVKNKF